ncbi:MAG: hypothetical protein KDB00_09680 [Planctomycetales bacterium]|nr:hypothetical protein [Planctomycetales bacterium]
MQWVRGSFFLCFVGTLFFCTAGCGSGGATVAPRTEDEIQAYKNEVYSAEEEDSAAADADE